MVEVHTPTLRFNIYCLSYLEIAKLYEEITIIDAII